MVNKVHHAKSVTLQQIIYSTFCVTEVLSLLNEKKLWSFSLIVTYFC